MARNKSKQKFMAWPIEKHDTAAWADSVKIRQPSNVSVPDETEVINAKEYVDANEK